jgi:hypothetical protein
MLSVIFFNVRLSVCKEIATATFITVTLIIMALIILVLIILLC